MSSEHFVVPRPKKSTLPPQPKKRKRTAAIEEISFDFDARADYLTGFHKRKVERIKRAQAENEKKAKEERILQRKQLREERTQELKEHVAAVDALLAESKSPFLDHEESGEDGEWDGIKEEAPTEPIDHEEEYIDEDRFTTVTVEEVGVSKDGLHTAAEDEEEELEGKKKAAAAAKAAKEAKANPKKQWPKKEKKKPFRYETKTERKIGRAKQKSSNKKQASARRGDD
ncbi:hypothetical protein V493_06286 [Pseudogymnoascus sp. VKM F-4281 (FW-2241)]|nr:hypothetical protein V493_06286 [Pseudogymnoascus sp. VKM F-4281 (FW-2241)]